LALLLHWFPAPGSGVQTFAGLHDPFWQICPLGQQDPEGAPPQQTVSQQTLWQQVPLQQSPVLWQPRPAPPQVSPQVPFWQVCRPGQSASTQHWWQV
jgi:hypothetical protein